MNNDQNHFSSEIVNAVFRRLGIDPNLPFEEKKRIARRLIANLIDPEHQGNGRANGAMVHKRNEQKRRGRRPSPHSLRSRSSSSKRKSATGKRRSATGKRRSATGKRRSATGKRRSVKGNRGNRRSNSRFSTTKSSTTSKRNVKSRKSSASSKSKRKEAKPHKSRRHSSVYERDATRRHIKRVPTRAAAHVSRSITKTATKGSSASRSKGNSRSRSSTMSKKGGQVNKTAATVPQNLNKTRFMNALNRLARENFTNVVSALQKKGSDNIWLLLKQQDKAGKKAAYVSLWGSAAEPVNLYPLKENLDEKGAIVAKMNRGYEKNPALKRMAANVIQKSLRK